VRELRLAARVATSVGLGTLRRRADGGLTGARGEPCAHRSIVETRVKLPLRVMVGGKGGGAGGGCEAPVGEWCYLVMKCSWPASIETATGHWTGPGTRDGASSGRTELVRGGAGGATAMNLDRVAIVVAGCPHAPRANALAARATRMRRRRPHEIPHAA
jgi:hypothetical protein